MHKLTSLAAVAAAAVCAIGLAISPALASDVPAGHGHGHGHGHGSHGPGLNISFASGPHSSAHWLPKQQAVMFRVGADTGGTPPPEHAAIVVHHFTAAPPAQAPTFSFTGTGMPLLEIGFTSGGYLQGTAAGTWTAYDATGTALASATDYATALAAEQGTGPALMVNRVRLVDAQVPQGAAYTDVITALQYNGVSLVPRGHHGHASGPARAPARAARLSRRIRGCPAAAVAAQQPRDLGAWRLDAVG